MMQVMMTMMTMDRKVLVRCQILFGWHTTQSQLRQTFGVESASNGRLSPSVKLDQVCIPCVILLVGTESV